MAAVDCLLSLLERETEEDSERQTARREAGALLVVRAIHKWLKWGG